MTAPASNAYRRGRIAVRLTALTPLWLQIVLAFASPTFFNPMFDDPPSILGLPLGIALNGLAMVWMVLGLALVWNARSAFVDALALVAFTFPATFVVIFGPAIILIMQNLG